VAERVRKWVWRRPAAAGLLAAAALLLTAVGVGAWLLYQQQAVARGRQEEIDHSLRAVLEREGVLLEEAWRAHDLAKLTAVSVGGERAVDMARGGASAAVQEEADALRQDAVGRLARATKNQALLDAVLDVSAPQETASYLHDVAGLTPDPPSLGEQYAAAFRSWGLEVDATAEADVVARLRQEPEVVQEELIAALDAWMLERRLRGSPESEWRRLFRLAEQLDHSARNRPLRAWLVGEPTFRPDTVAGMIGAGSPWPVLWELGCGNSWRGLLEVRRQINPQTEPVQTVVLLARALAAVGDVVGAEEVLRQAAIARPHHVVLLDALGKLLARQGRLSEAIGYYRAARGQRPQLGIALARALLAADRAKEAREVMQDLVLRKPDNPTFLLFLGVTTYEEKKDPATRTIFRKALDLNPNLAEAYYCLGVILSDQRRYAEAVADYQKAIDLHPDYPQAYFNLGTALNEQNKHAAAEPAFRKAIELRPNFPKAYHNLGLALSGQGKHVPAEAAFRKAIDLRPDFGSYSNLGLVLRDLGNFAAAEAACRKAVDLGPDSPPAHNNLGLVLFSQGKHALAEAAYRKAIDLQPDYAVAYSNLGAALTGLKKYADAEASLRKAIDLQPDFAEAYVNLGTALFRQNKHAAAEAAFRKAMDLWDASAVRHPRLASVYNDLGMALGLQGKHALAAAAFRKAVELQPDFVRAHVNLGSALIGQQRFSEAEAALRWAIDARPDIGMPHFFLTRALMRQARFDEAAAVMTKVADSLPAQDARRMQALKLQQLCQKWLMLDTRLPAILSGKDKPADASERLDFAHLCFWKMHYGAAARFYRDAFAAEPKLADDVPSDVRYLAACAAARAGCGQGKDAGELHDEERARWRGQALEWLRQDLAWWGKAPSHAQVRKRLREWQADACLGGVRGQDALARLPVQERERWESLWSNVDALLARISEPD
jgi:tetratricopeptide (TPR) repeat protein